MITVKIKFRLTYNIYTVHQTRIMHYFDFFLFLTSLQRSLNSHGMVSKISVTGRFLQEITTL